MPPTLWLKTGYYSHGTYLTNEILLCIDSCLSLKMLNE